MTIPALRELVGTADILFITLDTLRYDVAQGCFERGELPELAQLLPPEGWQRRHTPGSFTYPAHQAFFAGFLPTPEAEPLAPRLYAASFPGSESSDDSTWVFEEADLPAALAARGYRTVCIGGVGFFNKQTALGRVLPELFQESHWSEELGVTGRDSTRLQVKVAQQRLSELPAEQRVFLFLNVSALHQPNCIFTPNATADTPETMAAALRYADRHLGRLVRSMRMRAPLLVLLLSDHGTCYGEGGHTGHRLAHPVVWTVPFASRYFPR